MESKIPRAEEEVLRRHMLIGATTDGSKGDTASTSSTSVVVAGHVHAFVTGLGFRHPALNV